MKLGVRTAVALFLIFAVLVVVGVALVFPPAAFVVAGAGGMLGIWHLADVQPPEKSEGQ